MDELYEELRQVEYIEEIKRYETGFTVTLKSGYILELEVSCYVDTTHITIRTIHSDKEFNGCAILKYDKCFVFEDGVYVSDRYFMEVIKDKLENGRNY